MFRLLTALPLVALLFATSAGVAAPRPEDKPNGPHIVGQAKSFNDLLAMVKAIVKNVGGDAVYKEFETNALPNLDPKQLPGIDPKRPSDCTARSTANWRIAAAFYSFPSRAKKTSSRCSTDLESKPSKGKRPARLTLSCRLTSPSPSQCASTNNMPTLPSAASTFST